MISRRSFAHSSIIRRRPLSAKPRQIDVLGVQALEVLSVADRVALGTADTPEWRLDAFV
jgi:hypothetical protein